ncbi:YebC/PmpR family DNA-binding transcriptional regulator [Candidatus Poribacteria bacterium]|nr:YebC/PmpR family DNA-binding transcriptional regulator [Candidatus Poribacteria bacterium]
MAGHSKWANIQHRKGAQDAKRAKLFAKLVREVIVAAKQGIPDPDHNARLRTAIASARAQSVPKDNIDRAIKKIAGGEEGAALEEIRYEGYGPGGIAVLVDAVTDNRNRTAAEIRSIFNKHSGNLGETGCVAFMFKRVGTIRFSSDVATEEEVFEEALILGASDCEVDIDGYEVICDPNDFALVSEGLEKSFGKPSGAGLSWQAQTTVEIDGDSAEVLFKLLEALDDSDDVQQVSANFEVADELMQRLSG